MDRMDLISSLKETGKFMMDNDLAWGTAGNISARLSDDQFYVSATGTYLGELQIDDFSLCSKGKHLEGKKPSKEYIFHQYLYEERDDIHAILHASPFYSTLIANSDLELPSNYFVESMYYLEKVARIPFYNPGSIELADAIKEKANEANVFLLENHGVIVCDVNLKEARMALQTLEYTAKMHITALEKNINMNGLSEDTVKNFIYHSGYKPLRKWNKA
ncbi:class II aldolase/adducin family protein [Alkalihalobacillus trypoxylicola]|uniref:Fuculose phosphate aldolase n=1 Tax=Alkalihalobacillus trypoxylicola TaxID=519424 RepID=A0A161QIV0_9BACI|nr:class II aldolase/adducin family protein [Alkalihalobacillus trypoxylicola]KYG29468.1 fuculose phosphate aldolase [Alkalihalobacillus trypoxylicola]